MRAAIILIVALIGGFLIVQSAATADSCGDACERAYATCTKSCKGSDTDCFTKCLNERGSCQSACQ
jgi:hypothetical protein